MIFQMLSLKESIISSNNARHPAYRFSMYKENSVVSIITTGSSPFARISWDKKKVKYVFSKLDKVYKEDVRYHFNSGSDSKDKTLAYIWCIVSACKNVEEVEKTVLDLLHDHTNTKVYKVDVSTEQRPFLKIFFNTLGIYASVGYYIHTATEYSDYKYVK